MKNGYAQKSNTSFAGYTTATLETIDIQPLAASIEGWSESKIWEKKLEIDGAIAILAPDPRNHEEWICAKKQHRIHSHSSVKTRFLDTSFFLDGYRYIGYRIIPISKSSHRKSNQKSCPEKRKKTLFWKGPQKKKKSKRAQATRTCNTCKYSTVY